MTLLSMSCRSSVDRALPSVQEVMGSIPVSDSDCFFVRHLCHVEEFTFHMYFVLSMSLSKKERVNKREGRIITIVDKCCSYCVHAVSIATKSRTYLYSTKYICTITKSWDYLFMLLSFIWTMPCDFNDWKEMYWYIILVNGNYMYL